MHEKYIREMFSICRSLFSLGSDAYLRQKWLQIGRVEVKRTDSHQVTDECRKELEFLQRDLLYMVYL